MMNDKERLELIERISCGIASDDELGQYNAWCNSLQEPGLPVADFGVLQTRMLANINGRIDHIRIIRLRYYKIASVAAALVAVVFGLWFYSSNMLSNPKVEIVYQNDIAPGKNRAILTFANGKTIKLSDAQQGVTVGKDLKYYDGTEITAERTRPQLLTATTPRGGAYEITLSDGTRVWMNADSKLSFPSSFSGRERRVSLKGEAYFEVAKNYFSEVKGDQSIKERIPFVVVTDKQEVTVLGTHFNINSYGDEAATKTTLLEGSVRVAVSGTNNALLSSSRILKPGEQAINDGGIRIDKVDVEEVVAWKNGSTVFQDKTLESIMRELSRWYDITVVYAADAPRHEFFSGAVSRTRNISSVLERMQTTGSVKFKIEGRIVTVTK
ncbi:iron dicitrate transport regulator FecR [Pedobacter sp. HMWF019]|uniref:FecR family protein n=1 Tax=Pedobacter sp. HMWF019 TaxID=2056856 RepID=UPI000D390DDF|nr:FecR domain-containing protein [Pedobacter sp. HMWF019]PTS92369.1 iron dicitrate transport regulator FecR [Pedobacter sp. HMWF019]